MTTPTPTPTVQDIHDMLGVMAKDPASKALFDLCQKFFNAYKGQELPYQPEEFWEDMSKCAHESELHRLPQIIVQEIELLEKLTTVAPKSDTPYIEERIEHIGALIPLWKNLDIGPYTVYGEIEALIGLCRTRGMPSGLNTLFSGLADPLFGQSAMTAHLLQGALQQDGMLRTCLDEYISVDQLPAWCKQLADSKGVDMLTWAKSLGLENLARQLSKKEMLESVDIPKKERMGKIM